MDLVEIARTPIGNPICTTELPGLNTPRGTHAGHALLAGRYIMGDRAFCYNPVFFARDTENAGARVVVKFVKNNIPSNDLRAAGEVAVLRRFGGSLTPELVEARSVVTPTVKGDQVQGWLIVTKQFGESIPGLPTPDLPKHSRHRLIAALAAAARRYVQLQQQLPGFVHGDVKPENILYASCDPDGAIDARWIDFSYSHWHGVSTPRGGSTPKHAAPEIAKALVFDQPPPHTFASDVFAFCIGLFAHCTGLDPDSRQHMLPNTYVQGLLKFRATEWAQYALMADLEREVEDKALRTLIFEGLSAYPETRPSMQQIADELERVCKSFPDVRVAS